MRDAPDEPAAEAAAASERAPADPAPALAESLRERGFGIIDGFIDHKTVVRLRTCADLRSIRGGFKPAAIGGGRQRRTDIRGDYTCWLEDPHYPAERDTVAALERLRLGLNRQLILGLFDTEVHYASYPPGAAYAAHVDQPAGKVERCVTFALYLNLDWEAVHGGELRLYEAGVPVADIEPRGGRLVCFLTAGRLHEVLPAKRVRLALTGWFRNRAELPAGGG